MKQVIKDYVIKIGIDTTDLDKNLDAALKRSTKKEKKEKAKIDQAEFRNSVKYVNKNLELRTKEERRVAAANKKTISGIRKLREEEQKIHAARRKDEEASRKALERTAAEEKKAAAQKRKDLHARINERAKNKRLEVSGRARSDAMAERRAESQMAPFRPLTRRSGIMAETLAQSSLTRDSHPNLYRTLDHLNSNLASARAARDASAIDRLTVSYNNLGASITRAQREQVRMAEASTRQGLIMSRLSSSMRQYVGGFASIYAAGELGSRAYTNLKELQGAKAALTLGTGSVAGGEEQYAYAKKIAEKYSMDIGSVAKPFGQFTVAAKGKLSKEETRDVFESIMLSTASGGLSADQSKRVMIGFQQAMSKEKLSAQEYRQQIGEALPQAPEALQKVMGLSAGEIDKLMSQGKIKTKDVIVAWTKEMANSAKSSGALGLMMSSVQAKENELKNKFSAGIEKLAADKDVMKAIDNVFKAINATMDITGPILSGLVKGFSALFNAASSFVDMAGGKETILSAFVGIGAVVMINNITKVVAALKTMVTVLKSIFFWETLTAAALAARGNPLRTAALTGAGLGAAAVAYTGFMAMGEEKTPKVENNFNITATDPEHVGVIVKDALSEQMQKHWTQ